MFCIRSRKVLYLALAFLLCGIPLHAQQKLALTIASTTTCSAPSGSFLSIGLGASGQPGQLIQPYGGATITISSNASGNTVTFVGSGDGGTTWRPLTSVQNSASSSAQASSSTSASDWYQFNVSALTNVCAYISNFVGGTTTVSVIPSTASARSGSSGSGSGTVSGQANGVVPLGTTATTITQQSHIDDGVTTGGTVTSSEPVNVTGAVTATGGFAGTSDGVHAGEVALIGNTTAPVIPVNNFGFLGPNSASFTSWFIQPSATAPTAGCVPRLGVPSSNVSAMSCDVNVNYTGSTFTLSSVGGGNAVLGLSGTTSGVATITAPSVAGTSTNPILVSNVFNTPDGTGSLPAYSFTSQAAMGMFRSANNILGFASNAAASTLGAQCTSCWQVPDAGGYLFGSTASGGQDLGITRFGSNGWLAVGNGTVGNAAGFVTSGNKTFVTGDFTDSTSTTLQLITGLSWTLPTSKAINMSFHCSLLYDQATALVSDSFGVGVTGTAPTQLNTSGVVYVSTSALTEGTLTGLASTTPTAVVTFTPTGSLATIYRADIDGTIEQPSNATPGVLGIYVATTTGTDNIIVKRGSYCSLF